MTRILSLGGSLACIIRRGHLPQPTGRHSLAGVLVQQRCVSCGRLFCTSTDHPGTMLPWCPEFEQAMDPATRDEAGGVLPIAIVKERP